MFNTECKIIFSDVQLALKLKHELDWSDRDVLYKLIVENISVTMREVIPLTQTHYVVNWVNKEAFTAFVNCEEYLFIKNYLQDNFKTSVVWTSQD